MMTPQEYIYNTTNRGDLRTVNELMAGYAIYAHYKADTNYLLPGFLQAMNELCAYGLKKHTPNSFQDRMLEGNRNRIPEERMSEFAMMTHVKEHAEAVWRGEPHDHFKTKKHQLAAIAVNAMMEYFYADLDDEQPSS